jgi:hypothetical protein
VAGYFKADIYRAFGCMAALPADFIFKCGSRETDFGFALSAQLTTIGFSPSWRLCAMHACAFLF